MGTTVPHHCVSADEAQMFNLPGQIRQGDALHVEVHCVHGSGNQASRLEVYPYCSL
jgi:hypothetical protein